MRYKIKFSYDGTAFAGFQKQKGLRTIEEELEKAVTQINNGKLTKITGAGRTDKKVHAYAQCAHFDLEIKITEYKLKRALNSNLPEDIHVIEAKEVDDKFHARYDVKEKTYQYLLNMGEYNPIERNYVFQYNHKLNIEKIKKASEIFLGEHDFRAFVTENKEKENCVRRIDEIKIEEQENKLVFIFKGNGFLRYQIRNMVGILIRVGEEKITPKEVQEILESKKRGYPCKTAPAEGLYLLEINYEER